MAVRDDRSDVKQTTAGFRGPLMVQSLTSAKSKFLSLRRLLFETSDSEYSAYLDEHVVGKIVPSLEGEAITQFRELLNKNAG